MTKREIKKYGKFTEVQKELERSGAAIYSNEEGENLLIRSPYTVNYIHSYAEDTPFFLGLSEGKLRGTKCEACAYVFATPRGHCQFCGAPTKWIELPLKGKVHSWTTCHFGSEAFLKETPYNLVIVEFEGANSVFLSRLKDCGEKDIYVGMPIEARFTEKPALSITDVWFVPAPGAIKK